jgi:hypothetical protein
MNGWSLETALPAHHGGRRLVERKVLPHQLRPSRRQGRRRALTGEKATPCQLVTTVLVCSPIANRNAQCGRPHSIGTFIAG